METLNAIFGRVNINSADMEPLLILLFSQTSLQLLQDAYRWADVNPSDIDEGRYTFLKRQSEVSSSFILSHDLLTNIPSCLPVSAHGQRHNPQYSKRPETSLHFSRCSLKSRSILASPSLHHFCKSGYVYCGLEAQIFQALFRI